MAFKKVKCSSLLFLGGFIFDYRRRPLLCNGPQPKATSISSTNSSNTELTSTTKTRWYVVFI